MNQHRHHDVSPLMKGISREMNEHVSEHLKASLLYLNGMRLGKIALTLMCSTSRLTSSAELAAPDLLAEGNLG